MRESAKPSAWRSSFTQSPFSSTTEKGRTAAVRVGLRVTGTIGILEAAAARGTIDLAVAMERLRETNARVDEELVQSALARDRRRR